ncbi:afadin isoform X7 [Colias croceus]|uniref:afadin isoform X7 n=1 Tax=Colias crocea TaxID=72248 RepID=UPI001E27C487|nr:afadin isoform X7 [Colias croceus]
MDAADKRMLDREALRNMIQQWNANRLDLFELSEPNENLEFHGVMRFYFQDSGQKIATKCIRVASDATVSDVIETLIEKFRPDMRMLSLGSYSLWETHGPDDERKLEPHEKPLLVQLNWHADDREGRFLLKCCSGNEMPLSAVNEKGDQNFKRKLSKREKKELKKKEKLSRLKSDTNDENRPVAEKLYTELPETSFTRSISNPEAVMRRRRQQKLERKLQQFRSKDGGPDTGGTLKIYGSSLCPSVPYKTLLLSVGDCAAAIVREMLDKYGLSRHDPHHYCIVQVDAADNSEYILEDDECPLAIVMTHPHRSSIMFHVRRRPSDAQPRRRKKKAGSNASSSARPGNEPMLIEVTPDGTALENGRRVRITDVVEVGSGNGTALQLYGPSIQPRHCVVAGAEGGGYTVTPLHTDAHVYVNGRRTMHTARLQHGCLLKFGRVSTFRFVDPAQENLINRNLSQSQHYGSGSIYDRSGADSGAMSPASLAEHGAEPNANANANTNANEAEFPRAASPGSHDTYAYEHQPYNNNTLKLDNESLVASDSKDEYVRDEHSNVYAEQDQSRTHSQYKDNYETTFDLDGNVETKSICSAKSGGSGHENRSSGSWRPGQEAILPAVLEFPEAGQAQFLAAVITRLDPHAPAFKLAPVYTLYLCARYRASTHYRPELTPTERAHKLTAFLHHVATLIHATVQERCTDSAAQAFWMANASELLHFLKCDRHISSFSTQAQELLPTTVQNAFSNLVSCFAEELRGAVGEMARGGGALADGTEATAPVLQALAAAMVLLRRCRVNAALTIQLFSHLFHFINAIAFNKLVTEPSNVSARWGAALSARLALLAAWAERQGLELAADCHLARTHQAARLIQGEYRTAEEVRAALAACFKLNSVQVRALLAPLLPPELLDAAVQHARALADELYRADGREIRLEENEWLGAALLIPGDGFSAEVVRGVPPGLAEFVAPLQRGGLCRLAHQPHAAGLWTVYMHAYGAPPRRAPDPRPQIIQLHKNTSGMGLSIVAAKGAGQSKLGIYIKSVVAGGAAAADGRLAAGDQLLSVDGHSLVGISQEKAAEYLVRTGPTVTLEVAKQGAVLHGLATLLHQPTYSQNRQGGSAGGSVAGVGVAGARRASERDLPARLAAEPVKPSKSTPALHHAPAAAPAHQAHAHANVSGPLSPGAQSVASNSWANKSRSSHNLSTPHGDSFYQNLSSVHDKQDRWSSLRSSGSGRPQSAHFNSTEPSNEPSPAQQHQVNQANARAAKLAEMSEEVNRRQQLQHQHLQQHQHMQYQKPVMPQMYVHTGYGQGPQGLYGSSPQGLQNTPGSMQGLQNVQGSMHGLQNVQGSMQGLQNVQGSMQNVQGSMQALQNSQGSMHGLQNAQGSVHGMQTSQSMHGLQNVQGSMHGLQNTQGSMQGLLNVQGSMQGLQAMSPQNQQPSPQLHGSQYLHSQHQSPHYHNQHGQQQPQRYEWHQPGPPSPQRSQPPVAPKPHGRRPETEVDEMPHQHGASSVQPDDERYVASALDPPAVSVYPAAPAGGAGRGLAPHNPWQREERERQAEARRAAARARRDAAIAQLLALGASRTPVQNQQLRALQLERDFERRATQDEQDEAGTGEGSPEEESIQPELLDHERDLRSSHGPHVATQPQPQPHMHQQQHVHTQQQHVHSQQQHVHSQQQHVHPQQQHVHPQQQHVHSQQQHVHSQQQSQSQPQPKSILKTNTRTEIVNGYSTHVSTTEETRISDLSTSVSNLSMSVSSTTNNTSSGEPLPPAPPERGSSFAVMAGRRAMSPHTQHAHQQLPHDNVAPQSPVSATRDKRVSFHERAAEAAEATSPGQSPGSSPPPGPAAPPAPPASSPPPLDTPVQREDPDRFIEEAESMMSGPNMTSTTSPLNTHTPGVIGAQEVYRDPVARRLAAARARAAPAPVPEQLSFKEKMKMFALESGEASTPKDKVKISRAQRDIDAVH